MPGPHAETLTLRSRVVLPVCRPLIENAAVVVSGANILAVGRWSFLKKRFPGPVLDLGESMLLPGMVNAHCHLDYTAMAGLFPPPRRFTDWIKLITTEKAHWGFSDYAASWLEGAKMLLRTGTTTVADIEAVPELLPELPAATALRVISLLEMTGVRSRRHPKAILNESLSVIAALPKWERRSLAGLSPHAPYSTTPALLRASAAAAKRLKLRVATHVAESPQEFEMFTRGSGDLHDWLARNQRDMRDCDGRSPIQHLARCNALHSRLLAIHVNHLAHGDAELLARNRVSVVHCPRSHEFFRHTEFPRRTLAKAGVNLCLGTDSLASVRKHPKRDLELNLFLEMRAFAARHPGVSPRQILQMVTVNGARALGLRGKIGELKRNSRSDMIAVPFAGRIADAFESLVNHAGDVSASMIAGRWVLPPK
jgi:cytosine/adenosine deaminase-related metal-dependent hydrolase